MQYFVAQKFPNHKSNPTTLKLVRINPPKNGSLAGRWMVTNNDETIATFEVTNVETYESMKAFYIELTTSLELTLIDGTEFNLNKY